MPIRAIYVSDSDEPLWGQIEQIAGRRKLSLSKQINELIRDFVRENQQAKELGLPLGFAIPVSMKDPKVLAVEQAADDIRAQALKSMLDVIETGGAS